MSGRALLGAFVLGLAVIGGAGAGLNANWSDHLTGAEEVPVRDTRAQGQAIFHLSDDGQSIDYRLIATNIDNVRQAHIHIGAAGANGPVVVPFTGNGETEQRARGERLRQFGLAVIADDRTLTPELLAHAVDEAGSRDDFGRWDFDSDGATRTATLLAGMLDARVGDRARRSAALT